MGEPAWRDAFLRLVPEAALKRLEEPCIYHVVRDELYELDETALAFLARCDGSKRGGELTHDGEFVTYCLREGLIEALTRPEKVPVVIGRGPTPSLRYLELQLLHRCNLRCRHCYLGPPRPTELPIEAALAIAGEFAALGGLRLLISGGEPLLYPHLRELLEKTRGLGLRRVILTNGTLITPDIARWLDAEAIQVSLDGWQRGHDLLRGEGAFAHTVAGIRTAREAGISVGIATVVHRGNLAEFDELARFVEEIEAVEWGVDVLCIKGELVGHKDLLVPYAESAPFMTYGFGGGYHGIGENGQPILRSERVQCRAVFLRKLHGAAEMSHLRRDPCPDDPVRRRTVRNSQPPEEHAESCVRRDLALRVGPHRVRLAGAFNEGAAKFG